MFSQNVIPEVRDDGSSGCEVEDEDEPEVADLRRLEGLKNIGIINEESSPKKGGLVRQQTVSFVRHSVLEYSDEEDDTGDSDLLMQKDSKSLQEYKGYMDIDNIICKNLKTYNENQIQSLLNFTVEMNKKSLKLTVQEEEQQNKWRKGDYWRKVCSQSSLVWFINTVVGEYKKVDQRVYSRTKFDLKKQEMPRYRCLNVYLFIKALCTTALIVGLLAGTTINECGKGHPWGTHIGFICYLLVISLIDVIIFRHGLPRMYKKKFWVDNINSYLGMDDYMYGMNLDGYYREEQNFDEMDRDQYNMQSLPRWQKIAFVSYMIFLDFLSMADYYTDLAFAINAYQCGRTNFFAIGLISLFISLIPHIHTLITLPFYICFRPNKTFVQNDETEVIENYLKELNEQVRVDGNMDYNDMYYGFNQMGDQRYQFQRRLDAIQTKLDRQRSLVITCNLCYMSESHLLGLATYKFSRGYDIQDTSKAKKCGKQCLEDIFFQYNVKQIYKGFKTFGEDLIQMITQIVYLSLYANSSTPILLLSIINSIISFIMSFTGFLTTKFGNQFDKIYFDRNYTSPDLINEIKRIIEINNFEPNKLPCNRPEPEIQVVINKKSSYGNIVQMRRLYTQKHADCLLQYLYMHEIQYKDFISLAFELFQDNYCPFELESDKSGGMHESFYASSQYQNMPLPLQRPMFADQGSQNFQSIPPPPLPLKPRSLMGPPPPPLPLIPLDPQLDLQSIRRPQSYSQYKEKTYLNITYNLLREHNAIELNHYDYYSQCFTTDFQLDWKGHIDVDELFKNNFDNFIYLNKNSKSKIRYLINKKMQQRIIQKLKDLKELVEAGESEVVNHTNAQSKFQQVQKIQNDIKEAHHIGETLMRKPFNKKLNMEMIEQNLIELKRELEELMLVENKNVQLIIVEPQFHVQPISITRHVKKARNMDDLGEGPANKKRLITMKDKQRILVKKQEVLDHDIKVENQRKRDLMKEIHKFDGNVLNIKTEQQILQFDIDNMNKAIKEVEDNFTERIVSKLRKMVKPAHYIGEGELNQKYICNHCTQVIRIPMMCSRCEEVVICKECVKPFTKDHNGTCSCFSDEIIRQKEEDEIRKTKIMDFEKKLIVINDEINTINTEIKEEEERQKKEEEEQVDGNEEESKNEVLKDDFQGVGVEDIQIAEGGEEDEGDEGEGDEQSIVESEESVELSNAQKVEKLEKEREELEYDLYRLKDQEYYKPKLPEFKEVFVDENKKYNDYWMAQNRISKYLDDYSKQKFKCAIDESLGCEWTGGLADLMYEHLKVHKDKFPDEEDGLIDTETQMKMKLKRRGSFEVKQKVDDLLTKPLPSLFEESMMDHPGKSERRGSNKFRSQLQMNIRPLGQAQSIEKQDIGMRARSMMPNF